MVHDATTHPFGKLDHAQIVPGLENLRDIWADAATYLPADLTITQPNTLSHEHLISPEIVASELERHYVDRSLLRNMTLKAHRHVHEQKFDWSDVAQQFARLFEPT